MDKHLQKVMLAALETLTSSLQEGTVVAFIEDIDPDDISYDDISELEARIEGLRPERLVITLEGGLVKSAHSNKTLMAPLEVYVSDLDVDDIDGDDVENLFGEGDDEWATHIRVEEVQGPDTCAFDIDKNISRIFGDK